MSARKKVLIMVLVGIIGMGVVCSSSVWAQEKKIIFTTMDLKQDYEILDLVAWVTSFTTGFLGDNITDVYNGCSREVKNQAIKLGADAVIGVQINLQNVAGMSTMSIYGTAVKFK